MFGFDPDGDLIVTLGSFILFLKDIRPLNVSFLLPFLYTFENLLEVTELLALGLPKLPSFWDVFADLMLN